MAAKTQTPLQESEILSALKKSGFPLEIRLLQAFDAAGFDPSIGHRFALTGEAASAEIDLIARCSVSLDNAGSVRIWAPIEAKNLGDNVAFVGLKWRSPSVFDMRVERAHFSGTPTFRVSQKAYGQNFSDLLFNGDDSLAKPLDLLNQQPFCPQWAIVRKKHDRPFAEADKEERLRESFAKLVRTTIRLERQRAESMLKHFRSSSGPTMVTIQTLQPTIVIGSRCLFTYDSVDEKLEEVPSLLFREAYEVDGQIHYRYVDVICESELPNFIARYRTVAEHLKSICDGRIIELRAIAEVQQEIATRR